MNESIHCRVPMYTTRKEVMKAANVNREFFSNSDALKQAWKFYVKS